MRLDFHSLHSAKQLITYGSLARNREHLVERTNPQSVYFQEEANASSWDQDEFSMKASLCTTFERECGVSKEGCTGD